MITKQADNEETFYYHTDHLGTPKVMTDKLKKMVWNIEFDPFGNEVERKGRQGSYIRSVENNLRFPGQHYDAETGLHYNYFRDYNPVIGRYMEADPWYTGVVRPSTSKPRVRIKIPKPGKANEASSSIDLYHYAANNPLRYVDLNGLSASVLCYRLGYIIGDLFSCYKVIDSCPPQTIYLGTFVIQNAPCVVACNFPLDIWNQGLDNAYD